MTPDRSKISWRTGVSASVFHVWIVGASCSKRDLLKVLFTKAHLRPRSVIKARETSCFFLVRGKMSWRRATRIRNISKTYYIPKFAVNREITSLNDG